MKIYNLSLSDHMKFHERIYLHRLKRKLDEQFRIQTLQSIDLNNSMKFDIKLLNLFYLFEDCIHEKLSLTSSINNDFIDLNKLRKLAISLLHKKIQLLRDIIQLTKQSRCNPIICQIIASYTLNFSFVMEKRSSEKNVSTQYESDYEQLNNFDNNYYQFKFRNGHILPVELDAYLSSFNSSKIVHTGKSPSNLNTFQSQACTLQMGMVGKNIGKVIKAQFQFYEIFGFSGKTCEDICQIIPLFIAKHHQNILEDYINSFDSSGARNNGKKYNLLLALCQNGWGVPIKLHFQTVQTNLLQEVQFIAIIHQIESSNQYVMIDSEQGKILLSEIGFFNSFFSKITTAKNFNNIYLSRAIPILVEGSHDFQPNVIYSTLMFIPKPVKKKEISQLQLRLKVEKIPAYFESLNIQSHNIYQIQCQIHNTRNKYFNFQILEIVQYFKLDAVFEIVNALKSYEAQIQEFFNYQIDFKSILLKEHEDNQNPSIREQSLYINVTKEQQPFICENPSPTYLSKQTSRRIGKNFNSGQTTQFSLNEDFTEKMRFHERDFRPHSHDKSLTLPPLYAPCDSLSLSVDKSCLKTEPVPKKIIHIQNVSKGNQQQKISDQILLSESEQKIMKSQRDIEDDHYKKLTYYEDIDRFQSTSCQFIIDQKGIRTPMSIDSDTRRELFPNYSPSHQSKNQQFQNEIKKQKCQLYTIESEFKRQTHDSIEKQMSPKSNKSHYAPKNSHIDVLEMPEFKKDNHHFSYNSKEGELVKAQDGQNVSSRLMIGEQLEVKNEHFKRRGKELSTTTYQQGQKCESSFLFNKISSGFSIKSKEKYLKETSKLDSKRRQSKPKFEKEVDIAQQSEMSSRGSSNLHKVNFARVVSQMRGSTGLRWLRELGFIGVVFLVTATIYSFIQVNEIFKLEKQHFKNIAWPMEMRTSMTLPTFFLQYKKFYDNQIFCTSSDPDWINFNSINTKRIQFMKEKYYSLYSFFLNLDKQNYPYFRNLTNSQFQFYQIKDFAVYSTSKKVNQTLSLQYFLPLWFGSAWRYFENLPNTQTEEAMRDENFSLFNVPFDYLQESIESITLDILKEIEYYVLKIMIIDYVLSFIIIVSVFPVYYYTQLKCEKVLKLYATFSSLNLEYICNNLNHTISQLKTMMVTYRHFLPPSHQISYYNSQQNQLKLKVHNKKKTISSTNDIPRISSIMILLSILIFCVLSVQPTINTILITSLTSEQRENVKLMKTIYGLKAHLSSNLFLNMGNLLEKMCQTCQFFDRAYFQRRVPVYFSQNTYKLSQLYSIVQEANGTPRYSQYLYDNFLFKLMEGNLCEALKNYPEYITASEFDIDLSVCEKVLGGVLSKGFEMSAKYLIDLFPPLFQLTQSSDIQVVRQNILKWESQLNMLELDQFTSILLTSITTMKNFMISISDDYMSHINTIEMYLLSFYCVSITILIFILGIKFHKSMSLILVEGQQILSLVDIDSLYQNIYTFNYLHQLTK